MVGIAIDIVSALFIIIGVWVLSRQVKIILWSMHEQEALIAALTVRIFKVERELEEEKCKNTTS